MKKIVLAMLMFTFASLEAEVITFEGTHNDYAGLSSTYDSYATDNTTINTYTFSNTGSTWWVPNEKAADSNRPTGDGDYVNSHRSITMTNGPTPFDLYSFELAGEKLEATTLMVSGVFALGGSPTELVFNSSNTFETQMVEWTGLISVTFTKTSGNAIAIDNIVLENGTVATPEPSSYALILLGMCGLIVSARRQKQTMNT
ncbi:MAG: PEP-CTERM sorting domain-containing protein [Lentisphaeraceae bacterium]|nr:PEP-CTERM sorting domain-containing protein [Lentisphaeraceae bacterium]